ncbi:MAG: high-affinity nickel-transporter [Chloroflexi bacterium]|nr:high-affinity nickel-transporter [Chloroflexota bacterium]
MIALRTGALTLFAATAALTPSVPVAAHPLGNFTVNRYSGIEISAERVRILYVLDMAEIPTFQEMPVLDSDRDGRVSDGERAAYLGSKAQELRRGLHLTVTGVPVALHLGPRQLTFIEGQGGLQTLRLTLSLDATPVLSDRAGTLQYRDGNYADRLGWREIVIQAGQGVEITSSTAPSTGISDQLRAYPEDLLARPLDRGDAQATFVLSASLRDQQRSVDAGSLPATAEAPARSASTAADGGPWAAPLAAMLAQGHLDGPQVALALLLAALWGASHALSPGHGKTVAAAYLVGARGTARHAAYLGLTVTATHTLGIYALGLVTLFATRFILPELLFPWLALLSGLAVLVVGVSLAAGRAYHLRRPRSMTHDHHGHTHPHPHDAQLQNPKSKIQNRHGHTHSHVPPATDGQRTTLRSLLALGVAGGLLPCPSALVLLLGAIALGEVGLGLTLVGAFSIGLAGVLTAVGLVLVYGRRLLPTQRLARFHSTGRLLRAVPIGSALIISIIGLAMTVQALGQTGLLRL